MHPLSIWIEKMISNVSPVESMVSFNGKALNQNIPSFKLHANKEYLNINLS